MNAGDLDQRLIFIVEEGLDEAGFSVPGPTEYCRAWGALKTITGHSFYAAAQSNMQHNREFTIRYQTKLADGIRPKNLYVMWRNMKHKIESIEDEDGQKVKMIVRCKAVS